MGVRACDTNRRKQGFSSCRGHFAGYETRGFRTMQETMQISMDIDVRH